MSLGSTHRYRNPGAVPSAFASRINIPWGNATCANSDWTLLTDGAITRSGLDWSAWGARRSVVAGAACGGEPLWERRTTLRDALAMCSVATLEAIGGGKGTAPCAGISVESGGLASGASKAQVDAWLAALAGTTEGDRSPLQLRYVSPGVDRLEDVAAEKLPLIRGCSVQGAAALSKEAAWAGWTASGACGALLTHSLHKGFGRSLAAESIFLLKKSQILLSPFIWSIEQKRCFLLLLLLPSLVRFLPLRRPRHVTHRRSSRRRRSQ